MRMPIPADYRRVASVRSLLSAYRQAVAARGPKAPDSDRLGAVDDERLPALVVEPGQQPQGRDPYTVYLGQLSGETLRTMRGCLDRLARIVAGVRLDEPTTQDVSRGVPVVTGAWVPWWELRYEGTAALRAVMLDIGWSPSHVNKHLSALRRVLKESWRLGLMSAEDYHRAIDLSPVKAQREPAAATSATPNSTPSWRPVTKLRSAYVTPR